MTERTILLLLILLALNTNVGGLKQPLKRPDGSLYFPGRGCGISESYKFISSLPKDTSGLKCVFHQPRALKRYTWEELDHCLQVGWIIGAYVGASLYGHGLKELGGIKGCQSYCHRNVDDCHFVSYFTSEDLCYFFKTMEGLHVDHTDYIAAPSSCEINIQL